MNIEHISTAQILTEVLRRRQNITGEDDSSIIMVLPAISEEILLIGKIQKLQYEIIELIRKNKHLDQRLTFLDRVEKEQDELKDKNYYQKKRIKKLKKKLKKKGKAIVRLRASKILLNNIIQKRKKK